MCQIRLKSSVKICLEIKNAYTIFCKGKRLKTHKSLQIKNIRSEVLRVENTMLSTKYIDRKIFL